MQKGDTELYYKTGDELAASLLSLIHIYHVRTDCSGYVSACLQVYGSTTGTFGTGALISDQHFPGFVYMRFPGWNNLQQGDILVRRFTGTDSNGSSYSGGHTEIFYGNSGGQHLVFSNGSTAGTVSYTHLDVYKRQHGNRLPPN